MQIKVGTGEDGNSAYIPAASSGATLFTDQAMHAAPLGSRQSIHRGNDIVGNPFDVTELMIAREMEKRRIREEILTADQLLRRRELEAEVVREIMMEREIFMRQGGSVGLPSVADSLLRPEGQGGVLALGRRDGYGIRERPVAGLSRQDGSLSLVTGRQGGALGGCLSQCQPEAVAATNGVAAKPIYNLSKGQPFPLVKPMNSSMAGMKRKFEASIAKCGKSIPSMNSGKEIQKEWSCALCGVTATSERGLQDHLKGRKHKAKERTLPKIGRCLNENLEEMDDLETLDHIVQQKADLQKRNGGAEESEKQTTTLNADFKFWCTMCKVGTTSEALMTAHRMGEKHMTLLQENGGGVIAIKTMPEKNELGAVTN